MGDRALSPDAIASRLAGLHQCRPRNLWGRRLRAGQRVWAICGVSAAVDPAEKLVHSISPSGGES